MIKKILGSTIVVLTFLMPSALLTAEEDAAMEEVVVTGSRIARSNTDSVSPITVIDRSEIEELAQTSIGDFLQDLPENIGGLNAQNNNGGNGSTQISLRGLGSGRTLVLLNGRRHVPYSSGGTVDMNAIAPNTIERIEVLNDGASTVYGADAVAGVINIITRRDFEGAEFSIYSGQSSDSDGEITDLNLTFGASNDRGNVTVSVGHYEMEDVMAGGRAWARQDLGYDWEEKEEFGYGSSATPEGTIIDRLGAAGNATWDAVAGNGPYLWGPGGNNSASNWSSFSFDGNSDVGEGSYYNYQPENYLYTPQERTNVFVQGYYQLTDDVNGFAEVSYINRRSDQLLAPTPLFIISEGLTIDAEQAHNPFGRPFIDVRRRMVEAGNRNFIQDIDTFRFVGGLEWSMGNWDADVAFNFGRTDGTDTNEGRFIRSRVLEALSADCSDPCVPLDLFHGPGSITQDQIDYISYTGTAKTTYEQKTWSVNVSNSNLFSLPAGSVGLAFGFESREESGAYVEDPLTEAGDTTGNKGESTRGSYEVDEAYLEVLIPLLDGGSMGTADLEYSIRSSDYSNFGSTDNQKIGFRWDFTDWIAVRATVSEAFKAPSVSSLFAGQSDSFPLASDPCSNIADVGAYGTDATVTANCNSDGLSGGTNDPNVQLRARVGGNPDLGPETADSFQVGLILNPIQDLTITIDSWEYELSNTIGSIGVGTILGGCYYSTERRYCDKVERDSNGLITNIYAQTTNIGEVETSGVDIQANYDFDLGNMGSLSLALDYTILDSYEIRTPNADGSTNTTECVGVYDCGTLIENRWILDARWSKGDYSARVRVNFYDKFSECEDDYCQEDLISRTIDSVYYVSLGLGYNFGQGTRLGLNVSNLTDENPPRIYNGFYSAADVAYDFMGRYYTVSLNHKF